MKKSTAVQNILPGFPGPKYSDVELAHFEARIDQHNCITKEARELFEKRNKEYGESFSQSGLIGITAELNGVIARLRQLVLRGGPDNFKNPGWRERVNNAYIDCLNYAVICRMLLDEENYYGEESE